MNVAFENHSAEISDRNIILHFLFFIPFFSSATCSSSMCNKRKTIYSSSWHVMINALGSSTSASDSCNRKLKCLKESLSTDLHLIFPFETKQKTIRKPQGTLRHTEVPTKLRKSFIEWNPLIRRNSNPEICRIRSRNTELPAKINLVKTG